MAVLLAAWLLWPKHVKNCYPHSGPIVILGDSLAAGTGSETGRGYVTLLQQRLKLEILNRGIPGDTTAGGLERLQKDVLAERPALVLVELGGNDFLRKVPREETFANLDQIVTRCQNAGAAVLLIGVQTGAFADDAAALYRSLAKKRQTAYVPNILDGILLHPELKADYIHPNDRGYERVADKVEPELRWMLRKMNRL